MLLRQLRCLLKINNNNNMEKKVKQMYETPELEIVEIQVEIGYATSGGGLNPMPNDGPGW